MPLESHRMPLKGDWITKMVLGSPLGSLCEKKEIDGNFSRIQKTERGNNQTRHS
jgi:hypothetical protein